MEAAPIPRPNSRIGGLSAGNSHGIVGLQRLLIRLLEFDQNHPVAPLVAVHSDRSRILQDRDCPNLLGRDIVDRGCRPLTAIDQDQRIGAIGGQGMDFRIFFRTFVFRKEIDGFGKGPEGQRRERQEQKHAGSAPP